MSPSLQFLYHQNINVGLYQCHLGTIGIPVLGQEHALEHAVREAIQTWMESNGINTTTWAFESMRKQETIPGVDETATPLTPSPEPPEDMETKR